MVLSHYPVGARVLWEPNVDLLPKQVGHRKENNEDAETHEIKEGSTRDVKVEKD